MIEIFKDVYSSDDTEAQTEKINGIKLCLYDICNKITLEQTYYWINDSHVKTW